MRFSVWPALERSWGEVLELAQRSEATGWDGFWAADHFMVEEPGESPTGVLEVWSTLAGLAAATSRITLGSLVCSVTYRHPAVLASAAVTCDIPDWTYESLSRRDDELDRFISDVAPKFAD